MAKNKHFRRPTRRQKLRDGICIVCRVSKAEHKTKFCDDCYKNYFMQKLKESIEKS